MTDRVKWPVGGYAPGGYAGCKCNICGEYFIAAKRAYTCADCTIQSLLAERDRLRDEAKGALAIIATERAEVLKLRAERDRLRETGQAVVDRWDTPLWKEAEATGRVINRLRAALKGDQT